MMMHLSSSNLFMEEKVLICLNGDILDFYDSCNSFSSLPPFVEHEYLPILASFGISGKLSQI